MHRYKNCDLPKVRKVIIECVDSSLVEVNPPPPLESSFISEKDLATLKIDNEITNEAFSSNFDD